MIENKVLYEGPGLRLTIERLAREVVENHGNFSSSVIIGLQPRGILLAERLADKLRQITGNNEIPVGKLDITFYRDDFRRRDEIAVPSSTEIDFIIENKKVILVDDVLYTGRSIRAGLDALLAFGRPQKVELLVLIDRRFSRDLPIEATYVGKKVDTISGQKVKVEWGTSEADDRITLYTPTP